MGADLPHLPDISPVLWGGGGGAEHKKGSRLHLHLSPQAV